MGFNSGFKGLKYRELLNQGHSFTPQGHFIVHQHSFDSLKPGREKSDMEASHEMYCWSLNYKAGLVIISTSYMAEFVEFVSLFK